LEYFPREGSWVNSYRPYLLQALELTYSGGVLEMGVGNNSSPFLKQYCGEHGRALYSYDNDREWAHKFGACYVGDKAENWEASDYTLRDYAVAFIDHSPPFHRPIAVRNLLNKASIFVIHDTQPSHNFVYHLDAVFPLFKYVDHYCEHGSWATICSNIYDVTRPK
jgi:hypothetical protein